MILNSLPHGRVPLEPIYSDMGLPYLWLPSATLGQMRRLRRYGEGYSEVILRLAKAEAELEPGGA